MPWFKSKCKHGINDLIVESYKAEVGVDFTTHVIKYLCIGCDTLVEKKFATFTKGVDGFLQNKGD
jgi:hypothetical protein